MKNIFFFIKRMEIGMPTSILLFIVILFGIFDVDWLTCTSRVVEKRVIRICVNNLDRLLYASSLQLIRKQSTECVLMCKILCGGFHFWRGIIEMKYQGLQKERI